MSERVQFGDAEVPTPPWRKVRRQAPPRRPVTQDLIVDAALELLDREGLDGVSMRQVAQHLDTGPATLYAHVSNKEELLELMLDRVAGEIETPEPDPERWQEQVKEIARSMFRVLSAHADIARVSLATVPTGPNALRVAERLLTILLAGGVPARTAAWGIDRLFLYISADAYEGSLHHAKQRASGKDLEQYIADFLGQVRGYLANLPPEHFPNTVKHVDDLVSAEGDERFEFGLDLFVQGLAARVDRGSDTRDPGAS
jgi:AcrR family transcriptional regulator